MAFMDARVVAVLLGNHDRCTLEQVVASPSNRVFRLTLCKQGA
jgi:hypothetical protein